RRLVQRVFSCRAGRSFCRGGAGFAAGCRHRWHTLIIRKGGFAPFRAARPAVTGELMRVYLPTTLTALACLLRAGEIGPAPVRGYAVTPALREWYASGDLEELEYVAMAHAARASLRLLADDSLAPRRPVVLAADLPARPVGPNAG